MTAPGEHTKDQAAEPLKSEEARIRAAYARRQSADRRYSFFNRGNLFAIQSRERKVLSLLQAHGVAQFESKKILEIGCGSGFWIREFIKWGARPENIYGLDLLDNRIGEARRLCPETVNLKCGSAAALDFPDTVFDIVLQSTVFTSILDNRLRQQIAAEMQRVLKPDGLILWYDFCVDNPWNPDVRGVNKKEILQLFSGCHVELRRVTLAPPLCRRIAPYSWTACHLLEKIPVLRTHYLGVIRKT
jgi:ubiquinone/menaquinone biosynthesis C-methylase UbiE